MGKTVKYSIVKHLKAMSRATFEVPPTRKMQSTKRYRLEKIMRLEMRRELEA